MSTTTLPNIRVSSDLTVRVRLKDGGVAIDWSTLNNIKAHIYSDAQRALAGRCDVSVDAEDATLLVCNYAANKPQYVGVNRIVVSAKYMGETKTYDKPAFNFVRWTADQEGEEITIDDPDVDVEIEVEDVTSSILQEAIDAALQAAADAEHAAHLVPLEVLQDCEQATADAIIATAAANAAGIDEVQATVDAQVGTPSVDVDLENKVLSLDFHNMKGETGEAAGFGTASASLTEDGGDPGVTVSASGPDTAKQFAFTFKNLKGDKGDKGDQGNTGASVEYPYELVNNLTTNDATKGLAASQGVALAGEVSQLEAEMYLKIDGEAELPKQVVWSDGYIAGTTGVVSASTTSKFSQPILLKAGETLSYKTGATYSRAVVQTANDNPVSIGDTLSGAVIINYGTIDSTVEYTATEDIYIVITCQKASNNIVFIGHNPNSVDNRLDGLEAQVDDLEDSMDNVEEKAEDLSIKMEGFTRTGTVTSAYGWLAYDFLIQSGNVVVNNGVEVNLYEEYDVNGAHHYLGPGESVLTTYPVRAIRGAGTTGEFLIKVVGLEEKNEELKEEILKDTEVRTPFPKDSVLTGYKLNPSSKYAAQNEDTDVVEYAELPVGTKIRIVSTNTNTTPLARVQSIPGFSSSTAYKNLTLQSGIPFYYTIEEGYQYLKVCCNTGTTPSVDKVIKVVDAVGQMSGAIGRCDSSLGSVAGRATIASLADTEQITLDNYPYNSPKGLAMSLFADITTFGKVLIGKGLNTYRGHWLEIDGTNIVEKFYEGSESTLSTTAHGLTISTYIKVVLSTNYAGKCKVSLETLAGHFEVVLDWGYEANGKVFAKSVGSSLTDVVLAATDTDFKLPIWVVGDSYLGIAANRWPGQLKDIGYFNYLINALAGINSTNGLADFKRCLNFGTPKFVIWALGANDYQNIATAISNAQAAQALCDEKGITLLLATVPNMPGRDFTTYNTWVHSQTECRIVDIAKAVGNPVYESGVNHWYGAGTEYDYLSTDQIHPTRIGAYAMATQVLTDFPEIMQYGLYSDDTTLDDTTTDQ